VPAPPPPPAPAPPVSGTVTTEVSTAAAAAERQSDHERVSGHYGVGLLGVVNMGDLQSDGGVASTNVPVLGARRWINDAWGIQAGLGLAHHSGTSSTDVPNTRNLEDPTRWAFAAHVGVPFALYHDSHYAFLFLPEANFGYSTWREKDDRNLPGDQGQHGHSFLVDVAARAGAEIHFGFMGLPMLTLQGTVGAHVTYRDSRAKSVNSAGQEVERGRYSFDLTTANYDDPWDIFTSSIAALYYFK
jgi:5-hydroxyisourate hydrolase-like protein (transthyretin family)